MRYGSACFRPTLDGRLIDMNFGKAFGVVLILLGFGMAAHAQVGVYVGYTGTRLTGIDCLTAPTNGANSCSADSSPNGAKQTTGSVPVSPSGLFVGGYYDFRNVGPVRLGVDLRYIGAHNNKSASSTTGGPNSTSVDTTLVGIRGSFHTPISWLKPYGQVSFGRTYTDAAAGTGNYANYLQYEVFAGADVHVFPFMDLRVVELGIGNNNLIGSGSGSNSFGVKSVGGGIVFHMPH